MLGIGVGKGKVEITICVASHEQLKLKGWNGGINRKRIHVMGGVVAGAIPMKLEATFMKEARE